MCVCVCVCVFSNKIKSFSFNDYVTKILHTLLYCVCTENK